MERKKTNPSQHNWSLTIIEQMQYDEEKVDFSTNGARTTLDLPHAKKIETSFTIINTIWITSLNSEV